MYILIFLEKYKEALSEIESVKLEIKRHIESAGDIKGGLKDEMAKFQAKGGKKEGVPERYAIRLAELEEKLKEKERKARSIKAELEEKISELPSEKHKKILFDIYIELKSLDEVCKEEKAESFRTMKALRDAIAMLEGMRNE